MLRAQCARPSREELEQIEAARNAVQRQRIEEETRRREAELAKRLRLPTIADEPAGMQPVGDR